MLDAVLDEALRRIEAEHPRAILDPDTFKRHALYVPQVDAVLRSHSRTINALFSYYTRKHDTVLLDVAGWLGFLRDAALVHGDVRPPLNASARVRAEGSARPKLSDLFGAAAPEGRDAPPKARATLPRRTFDGDLTVADARCCFVWARIAPPESNVAKKKAASTVRNTQTKVKPTSVDSLTRIDFLEALCWLAVLKPLPGTEALRHSTWDDEGLSLIAELDALPTRQPSKESQYSGLASLIGLRLGLGIGVGGLVGPGPAEGRRTLYRHLCLPVVATRPAMT